MPKDNKISSKKQSKTTLPGVPNTRQSEPTEGSNWNLQQYIDVTPSYIREMIPIIRQLMMKNEDVGQAIHNIVTLGNTGHQIHFDRKRTPAEVDAMRNHIKNRYEDWSSGQAGMDGVVNRLIAQGLICGALSAEWVPNQNLSGIENIILVNPEEIEFQLNKRLTKYDAFQRIKNVLNRKKTVDIDLVPLNKNTYKYFALNGDGELPYGFPPYMSVLPRIVDQKKMDKNITFILDQMGLTGFLEALMLKPEPIGDEDSGDSPTRYEKKLDNLLATAKKRILSGFKDGVVVGFKEDHEFNFHSPSKSYEDAVALYQNNELMVASALKQDASLWGRAYSSSETQITIVFLKMLSELKNIHNILSKMLEFGYSLELRLAGFEFESLEVRFNKSTINDDLKYQQAEEIKLRNVKDKLILGIISQDTAADELGYEVPFAAQPMVSWDVLAGGSDPAAPLETDKTKKKADTKKKKTASATKKRRQGKAVPK